jgi:hypothetical protein
MADTTRERYLYQKLIEQEKKKKNLKREREQNALKTIEEEVSEI